MKMTCKPGRRSSGRYIDVEVNRLAAARYGLSVKDVQRTAATAVGGAQIGEKVEGLARLPINVRFPRETRDSVEALGRLPIVAPGGAIVLLSAVADLRIATGPSMIRITAPLPSLFVVPAICRLLGRERLAAPVYRPSGNAEGLGSAFILHNP